MNWKLHLRPMITKFFRFPKFKNSNKFNELKNFKRSDIACTQSILAPKINNCSMGIALFLFSNFVFASLRLGVASVPRSPWAPQRIRAHSKQRIDIHEHRGSTLHQNKTAFLYTIMKSASDLLFTWLFAWERGQKMSENMPICYRQSP
jgi:hypothetical protein